MNENLKNKISGEKTDEREISQPENAPENPADSNWQKDIETHDYYYDDSHGYEIYDANEDGENDED